MGNKIMKIQNIKHLAINPDADVLKIKTERNSLGIIKTIIIVLLIALQAALFVLSYLYLVSFFSVFALFSIVFTLITCVYVISSNKNSQSKPIWILFLLVCFSFGYVIYLMSHERIFWGKRKKKYDKILEKSYKHQNKTDIEIADTAIKSECKYLETAGNFVSYTNTDTRYFASGTRLFDNVLASLEKAEKFIFIEYFIISDGVLLERFLSILQEKVKQGVDVRIIYDDLGSHGAFKRRTKKRIKRAGIKLYSFNKLLPKFSVMLNFRDHRKIVVVDGKVAYTGGANLADEYVNEKRLHGYWKDAGIRVKGPAVDGFTLMFLRQWEFVTGKSENYENYVGKSEKTNNTSVVVPYADGLEYADNIGKNVYTNIISNASKKLYIMSPYFVIDDTINNLLINKAKSGVDVRIILPEIADKKFVYIVSRNNAEKLVLAGVKIYTMKNSFVHSKIVMNERSAVVGSINMDLRSFYQQFESALYLTDIQTLSDIEKDFETTFADSHILEKEKLRRNRFSYRVVAGVTNLISPFM